jgi:hypothetical protein
MQTSKAVEIAVASVLREYAGYLPKVLIRPWQSLSESAEWSPDVDRYLPCVDVRCAPPRTDENQSTLYAECVIMCATHADDDLDHAEIATIYEQTQNVVDALFGQFRRIESGDEKTRFLELMAANAQSGTFNFGGFTLGDSLMPMEDEGANRVGISLLVHYSRDDF